MKHFITAILILISSSLLAQKGIVRGTITDRVTGETLPFVNVYLESDMTKGTTTDLDGNYILKLDPGTHKIVYSFTSYATVIKELVIESGKTYVEDIKLGETSEELVEFKVTADKKAANTMAAFDREKMKSTNMLDGTSAEQMKKTGDGDAGEVIKRVTGVSVVGGKHVYVRGLGDRYTKTILNGMDIPGLDPDRNTVQMDIFPTNLIDNITVYKTFTPELPGDYTGGLVNIQTKDFPSSKILTFSAGVTANTVTTGNPNFILYQGGNLDFLGFDDGTRALPVNPNKKFPDPALQDPELTRLTQKFSPTMAAQSMTALPNQSYSFGIGNQFNFDSVDLDYGYNFFVSYQNQYSFNENAIIATWRREPDSELLDLFPDRRSVGNIGKHNVMWSALFGQSIKFNKTNKISLNLFHTQNGISTAAVLREDNFETNPAILRKQSLQYTQRSVSNLNLAGKHSLDKDKWVINWKISPSLSILDDPDIRSTILEEEENPLQEGDTIFSLRQSVGGEIRRIWRDMTERNISSRLDFERNFETKKGRDSKIKFGLAETYKVRDFAIYDYIFRLENVPTGGTPNDPDWFFYEENIWTVESDQGTYGTGERELANTYNASQLILSTYAMHEYPITDKFKAVYGARVEQAIFKYTGQNDNGSILINDSVVLNELNLLPAVNLVYNLKDTIANTVNLRASYSQTLARPSFREKSIAQIYDPLQGRRYNGNLDLLQTDIHNADLRWEKFYGRTEVLSASLFYKRFINPIEIVSFDNAPNDFKPVNAGEADVYGVELEVRKRLFWKDTENHKLYVGTNLTFVESRIDMNKVFIEKGDSLVSQKQSRIDNARDGEVIEDYRPMFGQSPYIINGYVSYSNDTLGLDVNVSYNVQGKRLAVIGIGLLPDVYEQPFHSLNVKASKMLGDAKKWKLSVQAQNLLKNSRRREYESFGTENQTFDLFYDGINVGASISYTF